MYIHIMTFQLYNAADDFSQHRLRQSRNILETTEYMSDAPAITAFTDVLQS